MKFCKNLWYSKDEEVDSQEIIGLRQSVDFTEDIELDGALSSTQNREIAGADNINVGPVSYTHLDVYKRQVVTLYHICIIFVIPAAHKSIKRVQQWDSFLTILIKRVDKIYLQYSHHSSNYNTCNVVIILYHRIRFTRTVVSVCFY